MSDKANILIIDEELFASITISNLFECIEHKVTSVRSGQNLLDSLGKPFDIIFLCCFPPYLLCKDNVSLLQENIKAPIILVAWEWFEASDSDLMKIGIEEIVYVPRDMMNLRGVIQKYLGHDKILPAIAEKPNILVVDDDESVLNSVADILITQFDVKAVKSPNEAIKLLENQIFHLIIADLMMEEMHGLELIQAARIIRPDIISIVITGYANQDDAIRSLKEGVYDFLEKPLKFDVVIQSVKRAWKMLKTEKENKCLIKKLKGLNQELRQEVEDHKKTVKALAYESILSRTGNIAKNEFIRNISHELHTPLNAVIEIIDHLMTNDKYKEDYKLMKTAKTSANNFLNILDEIISFSNIEIGKIDLKKKLFSINNAIDKVINIYTLIAKEKNILIRKEISQNIPQKIEGDVSRLNIILFNLVGNAVKFTEKGEVIIKVESVKNVNKDTAKLCFSIIDTGIGIPPEKQKIIFEPFTQGDGKTTRRFQGIGLGLTLSTRLIRLLGGEIWLESVPEKGSTFYFTLQFNFVDNEFI